MAKINYIVTSSGLIPASDMDADNHSKLTRGSEVEHEYKAGKRTLPQNNSLHKYLTEIARQMNDEDLDMREVITVAIEPTMEIVKEKMFHPIMKSMYPDVKSTKDLKTTELQKVYETFNREIGIRLGVSADWPDRFNRGKI